MTLSDTNQLIVVALGGNAITRGDDDSVAADYDNLSRSLQSIAELVRSGHRVVLTHGNGPQVGNQMIRNELALGKAPDLPLDLMVADLQGGLGYMIERVLRNRFLRHGLEQDICVLLTLVEVDGDDDAFDDPSKFVGRAYDEEEANELRQERGWNLKQDKGRGWRRVVASPDPKSLVEKDLVRNLVDFGALVIVTGGGGIPVVRSKRGLLRGAEAVVDKDLASAMLARDIGADELFILTAVEQVALDWGTDGERFVDQMTVSQARRYLEQGQFPAGSMGPKIEAVCRFVEGGGQRALITDVFTLKAALNGETGTWILPDEPT